MLHCLKKSTEQLFRDHLKKYESRLQESLVRSSFMCWYEGEEFIQKEKKKNRRVIEMIGLSSYTKTMLQTKKSVPRSSKQSDRAEIFWPS